MAIDWQSVKRILIIRLRSIGDAVLATGSLSALREFRPEARIDILLEDWVAPLYDGLDLANNVISVRRSIKSRLLTAAAIRRVGYDVVIDLHGGPTAAFFTLAGGSQNRVGYGHYRFPRIYNICPASASTVWPERRLHSAEQQMALLAAAGVPIKKRYRSRLAVTDSSLATLKAKLPAIAEMDGGKSAGFALIHPAAAFETKRWPAAKFAAIAEYLFARGLFTVAVAGPGERDVLNQLAEESRAPIVVSDELSLPEIIALASLARIFVGNDSGIAHIAAAVNTPTVVIFGSSNRDNWRPWTDAPSEIVFTEYDCQPCPGYVCEKFESPQCILSVTPASVIAAMEKVLSVADNSQQPVT